MLKTSTFNLSGITPNSTIIIGLSGGPDSVYLLHLLVGTRESLGLSLVAAHLDHEWRASSKDDATFCAQLCRQLNVPLVIKKASDLHESFEANGSQEQLGRNMRRFFLEEVRQEHTAQAIALAHHQDDQLETFFINLIRGTTITGLCGIKAQEGFYIRPLLDMRKQDILDYLHEHQIPYQTDPTNSSDVYLRNRIRATITPALKACDIRAETNSMRAIENLKETEQFLHTITEKTLQKLSNASPTSLDLKQFFELDKYLQKRVLTLWIFKCTEGTSRASEAFLKEVLRFLSSPRGGTHKLSAQWKLIKKQNIASLTKINT